MNQKAVFPGSFDPFTLGHFDLVQRGLKLFNEIHILIGINSQKKSMLSLEGRIQSIRKCFAGQCGVSVVAWEGLTTDYLVQNQIQILLRGVRDLQDYSFEARLASINAQLVPEVETLFLPASSQFSWLSSSVIKELLHFKKPVEAYLPAPVLKQMQQERILC